MRPSQHISLVYQEGQLPPAGGVRSGMCASTNPGRLPGGFGRGLGYQWHGMLARSPPEKLGGAAASASDHDTRKRSSALVGATAWGHVKNAHTRYLPDGEGGGGQPATSGHRGGQFAVSKACPTEPGVWSHKPGQECPVMMSRLNCLLSPMPSPTRRPTNICLLGQPIH